VITSRAVLAVPVVLLVVVAGCTASLSAPQAGGGNVGSDVESVRPDVESASNESAGAAGAAPDDWTWPADPPTDRLGWESGYWYNESIVVDQSDGLNASEREAFVARTMARIEVLRELEFNESVPVEVLSREEYRNAAPFGNDRNGSYDAWNNQVWEALLLVGEDRDANEVIRNLYDGSVLGYYSPAQDRIVIVSDGEQPVVGRATLAHELVHALQDQRFGLPPAGRTQDSQLARNGIVEGDARYVERLYEERCGTEWDCVPTPRTGGRGGSIDMGVFVTIYTPYSEGPTLVHRVRERGGWAAVNEIYANAPASTEQVIHPRKYPDERPETVRIRDRSGPGWSRFDLDPQADTVGEASLYAMFWANRGIGQSSLRENPGPYSAYNYSAAVTTGWAGDTIVPYRSDDGEYGYVFRTEWDTERDAEAFADRYTSGILRTRLDATRGDEGVYVVENGAFADAFRVTRDGRTVTIVNAPSAERLDEIHRE
jgi:hypothetical protein